MLDVKTLCLGVLTRGEMTGYEIKKYFEEAFSHFFSASYGSIYPALGDLTRLSLVECRDVAQAGRPDKKIYSVTAAGRAHLVDALRRTPPRHKVRSEFLVLMYFADLLEPSCLGAALDARARDIEGLLECIGRFEEAGAATPGETIVAGLGRVTLRAQLEYIRTHRHIVESADGPAQGPAANAVHGQGG